VKCRVVEGASARATREDKRIIELTELGGVWITENLFRKLDHQEGFLNVSMQHPKKGKLRSLALFLSRDTDTQ
jgi:hypothetical protein